MANFLSNIIGSDQETDIAINRAVANAIMNSNSPKKSKIINALSSMRNSTDVGQPAMFMTAFGGLVEITQDYNGGLESILKTNREWVYTQNKVEIDIMSASRNISPFGAFSGGWKEKNGYSWWKMGINIPTSKVKSTIKTSELRLQQAGIKDYQKISTGELLIKEITKQVAGITTDNKRSLSLMTAEAFQYGRIDLSKYFETREVIDMHRDPSLTISSSSSSSWDDPTHSILGQIGHICTMINEKNGSTVDTIILGKSAAENFIRNNEIKERLDNRRINVGNIEYSKSRIAGTQKMANMTILSYNLDILVMSDAFFDNPANNQMGTYVEKDAAIFLDLERCEPRRIIGPVDFVDDNTSINFGTKTKKMPQNGVLATIGGDDIGVYVTKSHENDAVDIFVQQSTVPVIANANATACLTTIHA